MSKLRENFCGASKDKNFKPPAKLEPGKYFLRLGLKLKFVHIFLDPTGRETVTFSLERPPAEPVRLRVTRSTTDIEIQKSLTTLSPESNEKWISLPIHDPQVVQAWMKGEGSVSARWHTKKSNTH